MKIAGGFNKFMGINMFESLFIWGEKFILLMNLYLISCNELFGPD